MKQEKEGYKQENDDYDYLSNSATTMDCTGLQYKAPIDDFQNESYDEVYHYLPPKVKVADKHDDKEGMPAFTPKST